MELIVKQASALNSDELAALGITGIPPAWPIESYPYDGVDCPEGFTVMSDTDMQTIKDNNQAAYDAWLQSLRPIVQQPPASPVNPDNVPIVELALPRSTTGFSNFTIPSHDFSDRTSWYQKSVQVTGETLSNSGDDLNFNSVNPHWININGPKLTLDYKKVLERDGTLSAATKRYVGIQSNGTPLVEGTDYTVDYPAGTVTFNESQAGNTILATYWHNNGIAHCSEFLFTPPPNTQYRIEHVETQFSKNIIFNNTIMVELWGGAFTNVDGVYTVNLAGYGGFSQAYFDAGYGQSRSYYRNVSDLLNWCTNQYSPIPACGNLLFDVLCFPFLYTVHSIASAKQGGLLRIYMEKDLEVTAEICTVTLYMEKGPA